MSLNSFRTNRLTMIRENLEAIPEFLLPVGFTLRWYVPGDEALWVEIHLKADRFNQITLELFQQQFENDGKQLAKRQCYLIAPDGSGIGTATAWFGKGQEQKDFGRVHWVALLPEYHGRGLSKPLLGAVCTRLRALGYTRAFLSTSAERIAAIHLYLQFGFKPWIQNVHEKDIWNQLLGSQYDLVSGLT